MNSNDKSAVIADAVVPQYRLSSKFYSCCGVYAKRWQSAYEAAIMAMNNED